MRYIRCNVSLRNDSLEDKGIIEEIGVASEEYRMTRLHRERRLIVTKFISRRSLGKGLHSWISEELKVRTHGTIERRS